MSIKLIGGDNIFHLERQKNTLNQLKSRWNNDRKNETLYLHGGVHNLLPKPVPQGSFIKPFGAFYNKFGDDSLRGGFRTQAGQAWGILQLQKRAKQLEELDALAGDIKEPDVPQLETYKGLPETTLTTINLLLDEIRLAIETQNYQLVDAKEMRELFSFFKDLVLDMSKITLQDYKGQIANMHKRLIDEASTEGLITPELTLWENTFNKIGQLLDLAIESYEMSPDNRLVYVKSKLRDIERERVKPPPHVESVDAGDDDELPPLEYDIFDEEGQPLFFDEL